MVSERRSWSCKARFTGELENLHSGESISMIDLQDKNYDPAMEELGEYVGNPVFLQFCSEIMAAYQCKEKTEYSSCSWNKG